MNISIEWGRTSAEFRKIELDLAISLRHAAGNPYTLASVVARHLGHRENGCDVTKSHRADKMHIFPQMHVQFSFSRSLALSSLPFYAWPFNLTDNRENVWWRWWTQPIYEFRKLLWHTMPHTRKPQITSEIFQNTCTRIDIQSIVE